VLIRAPHGHFATQALLCTGLAADPAQILAWFIQRWQLEVTLSPSAAESVRVPRSLVATLTETLCYVA
jgi:hypothetical protein